MSEESPARLGVPRHPAPREVTRRGTIQMRGGRVVHLDVCKYARYRARRRWCVRRRKNDQLIRNTRQAPLREVGS